MKSILLIYLVSISAFTISQTPLNDLNWNSTPFWVDDFNGTSLNTLNWNYSYPWTTCHGLAALTDGSNNRVVQNGTVKIITKPENSQCHDAAGTYNKSYSTGALFSNQLFKYGYFEIRCKLPQLTGTNYTGKGLGPNFWMWPLPPNSYDPALTNVRWSEIDFFEFDGEFNKYTCNIHYEDATYNNNDPYSPYWNLRQDYTNDFDFNVNFSVYHKFGCEWTPEYINFYFDDKLVRTSKNDFIKNLVPMNIIVDVNIPTMQKNPVSNTLFPYVYDVDYVKVYKLKMDCNTAVTVSNFNFLTFDNKVKKSIVIGGIQGKQPANTNKSLRAVESIIMLDGFEVPIGCDFYATNCKCEN